MNILYFVVPLALLFMGGSIWAFFWAARKGQFDDLDTPAIRLLIDDELPRRPTPNAHSQTPTPRSTPPPSSTTDDEQTPSV